MSSYLFVYLMNMEKNKIVGTKLSIRVTSYVNRAAYYVVGGLHDPFLVCLFVCLFVCFKKERVCGVLSNGCCNGNVAFGEVTGESLSCKVAGHVLHLAWKGGVHLLLYQAVFHHRRCSLSTPRRI